ncbi:hypothetical protein DRP04_06720 [Archaeoglobales archaeon]|nr:MAG: hypothetical protein DRP04_06720 [Archaeoglobales archaeon]
MNQQKARVSHTKDLFRDMIKYLPSFIVPGIVSFIIIPIITRLFPPDSYGNYVLTMAMVSIFSTFVGWVGMSIVRFYPAYKRDLRLEEFYATTLKLAAANIAILSLAFIAVLLIIRKYFALQLFNLMSIGLILFIMASCFEVLKEFLRSKRQVGWYTAFSVWRSIAGLSVGIVLATVFHYGVEGLLWGAVLTTAVALPLLWKIGVEKSPLQSRISTSLASEMAKYGFPLVVGNLAAWILSLSDRYVLEFFRGPHEVGIYSASYGISEKSILLIVSLFRISSGPIAMNIWEEKGEKDSKEFLSIITRYYLISCLPAVIGLSVLAKPVVGLLTGPEYHEAYRIVPLIALSALFLGLTHRFGIGFCYHKKTYLATICVVACGLLNLGLNFLLIPKYGYIAAAITTLISYAFFLLLQIVLSRRYFVWEFPFKSLVKVVSASSIMAAVIYPIGNSLTPSPLTNLIVGIFVGVIIYFIMLFLLGEIQSNEKQVVKQVLARYLPGKLTPNSWK